MTKKLTSWHLSVFSVSCSFKQSFFFSVSTNGEDANAANCVFPFTYQGQQYWECIVRLAVSDNPWCATTENYDEEEQWANCPRK